MSNLIPNGRGGITYATQQRIGEPEQRQEHLESVRYLVDTMQDLARVINADWPAGVPMTDDIKLRLHFTDFALARVRSGVMRILVEICEA